MKGSSPLGIRKGAWTSEEDVLLQKCIDKYGEGEWHKAPRRAGLNRCRKSCRLRWLNYLKPGIKRGEFEEDEVDMVIRLQKLLGNRWSLIAGRIPGRTANDIKNFWNTHLRKKVASMTKKNKKQDIRITTHHADDKPQVRRVKVKAIRPRPHNLSKNLMYGSIEPFILETLKDDTRKSSSPKGQVMEHCWHGEEHRNNDNEKGSSSTSEWLSFEEELLSSCFTVDSNIEDASQLLTYDNLWNEDYMASDVDLWRLFNATD